MTLQSSDAVVQVADLLGGMSVGSSASATPAEHSAPAPTVAVHPKPLTPRIFRFCSHAVVRTFRARCPPAVSQAQGCTIWLDCPFHSLGSAFLVRHHARGRCSERLTKTQASQTTVIFRPWSKGPTHTRRVCASACGGSLRQPLLNRTSLSLTCRL